MTKVRTWRTNLKLPHHEAEATLDKLLRQLVLALAVAERLSFQLHDTLFDPIDPIERLHGVNLQAGYWREALQRLGQEVRTFAPPGDDFEADVLRTWTALEQVVTKGDDGPSAA